jgi:predicted membrane metal-binding protein
MATPDPKSVRSRWSIRAHLSLLVSVVIVPLVLLTAYLVWDPAREEAKEARESTLRLAESAARNTRSLSAIPMA